MKTMKPQRLPASTVRSRAHLGVAIRRIRKLLNLTQGELAKLAGTTQATVSNLERGKSSADLTTLFLLLSALNLDLHLTPRPTGVHEDFKGLV